jgi:ABC-2 type transport system ATP-binding protein
MDAVEDLRQAAAAAGGRVADIRTREQSLEDIFLDLARGTPETDADRGREPVDGDGRDADSRPEPSVPEPGAGGGDRR